MANNRVKIDYGNLYITAGYVGEEGEAEEKRLPLKTLPEMEEADGEHIHGYLSITIGAEKLAHLGFFGEEDVCFNDWISHLLGIVECFSDASQSRFLFWDGEQGDDAFEFCRDNDLVYISHVDPEVYSSILSSEFFDSGRAKPDEKPHYICDYKDFDSSVRNFIERIKKDIFLELGDFASIWWGQNIRANGRCSHIKNVNA